MNDDTMLKIQVYLDGKDKKRDRFRADVSLRVDEAITLMRRVSAGHECHVVSECDLKVLFKEQLDEDIPSSAVLSIIHVPTSHHEFAKKSCPRTLFFPINVIFSWSPKRNRTKVEAIDPLTKSVRTDETLRPIVHKLRKTLKRVFKEFEQEAIAQAPIALTEGGTK